MNNNQAAIFGTLMVLGLVSFSILLWGIFVYNNGQNIHRDEYLVQHCRNLKIINTDNGFTTGKQYEC